MAVVNETLELPDETSAASGWTVIIDLAGEDGLPTPGFHGDHAVVGEIRPHVAADGTYTVDILRNDTIEPANTVWRRRVIGPKGYRRTDYFSLETDGPVDVHDVLTDPPGALEPSALAAALANFAGRISLLAAPTGDPDIDEETFVDALAALPATGGRLLASAGTYSGRYAIDKAGTTLEGQGIGATVFKIPDGLDVPAQGLTITADDVTVRDCTIDGNRDAQDFGGAVTRESDGISIYANRVLIDHVHVRRPAGHGVIIWNEATAGHHGAPNAVKAAGARTGCTVRGSIIEDNGHPLDNRSAIDIATSNTNVDHEIIDNLVIFGDHCASGITMHGGSRTLIDRNRIFAKTKERAIMVHTGAFGVQVTRNIISKVAGTQGTLYAVAMSATVTDIFIEGNRWESDRGDAAFCTLEGTATNLRMADNTVHFSAAAAGTCSFLRLGAAGVAMTGVRMRGNVVTDGDKPVHDVNGSAALEATVDVKDHENNGVVIAATAFAQPFAYPRVMHKGGGSWHRPITFDPANLNAGTYNNANLYALPIHVERRLAIDQLALEVTIIGTAGASKYRMGIYASDANGLPGALILDAGTVDTDVVGVRTLAIGGGGQVLDPGIYWLAISPQGAPAAAATVRQLLGASLPFLVTDAASSILGNAPGQVGIKATAAGTPGALPANFPAYTGGSSRVPAIAYRVV